MTRPLDQFRRQRKGARKTRLGQRDVGGADRSAIDAECNVLRSAPELPIEIITNDGCLSPGESGEPIVMDAVSGIQRTCPCGGTCHWCSRVAVQAASEFTRPGKSWKGAGST